MSDSWRFALIAVGAALILGAFVWRFVRSSRGSKQLSRALRDPDPLVRRAAIEVMSERGIGDYASSLRPMVNAEPDASVLDALALAITRNQWEPADNRKLVELRLWAKARNEAAEMRDDAVPKEEVVAAPVVDVVAPPVAAVAPSPTIEPVVPEAPVAPAPIPVAVVDTSLVLANAQREADLIVERARATARAIEAAARAERVQVLEQTYAEVAQLVAVSRDGHNAVLADARTLLDKFLSGESDLREDPRTHSGEIEIHEIAREDVDDDEDSDHDEEQRVVIVIRQEPSTKKKKK